MLRLFLFVTIATAACGDDDGGGGSTDAAPPSDAALSIDGGDRDAAVPDAGGELATCAPSGECAEGPACGDVCCGAGEACVEGDCRCGDGKACKGEQTCASPGPQGEDQCGTLCCGPGGPPCPD